MVRVINILFCFLLILSFSSVRAQFKKDWDKLESDSTAVNNEKKGNNSFSFDRLNVGGGLDFRSGNNFTIFYIAPTLSYRLTERVTTGIGGTYIYNKFKGGTTELTTHSVGGSLFSRYFFSQNFFAQAEYETINFEFPVGSLRQEETFRFWADRLLLGIGFAQPLGNNAAIFAAGFYDLLWSELESPYQSPFVYRVGISVSPF